MVSALQKIERMERKELHFTYSERALAESLANALYTTNLKFLLQLLPTRKFYLESPEVDPGVSAEGIVCNAA